MDEPKLNARGFLHAGAISTIADVCIGHALSSAVNPPIPLVTVNLNVNFIGTGRRDDWIMIDVRVHRVGGRVAIGSAEFRSGDAVIADASAVFVRGGKSSEETQA